MISLAIAGSPTDSSPRAGDAQPSAGAGKVDAAPEAASSALAPAVFKNLRRWNGCFFILPSRKRQGESHHARRAANLLPRRLESSTESKQGGPVFLRLFLRKTLDLNDGKCLRIRSVKVMKNRRLNPKLWENAIFTTETLRRRGKSLCFQVSASPRLCGEKDLGDSFTAFPGGLR